VIPKPVSDPNYFQIRPADIRARVEDSCASGCAQKLFLSIASSFKAEWIVAVLLVDGMEAGKEYNRRSPLNAGL
jgi:hypothetical protein